jgi:hypothetical protein
MFNKFCNVPGTVNTPLVDSETVYVPAFSVDVVEEPEPDTAVACTVTTLPAILAVVPVAKLIVVGTPNVVPLSCIVIALAVDVDTAYPFEYTAPAYMLPTTPTPPDTRRAPDVLEVAELVLLIVIVFGPNPVAVTALATNVAVLKL